MAWAQRYPGCNWGMVCDRIAVLDVDKHPNTPDGHAALAAIEAEHGKIETWLVHTPQDGRHYYFSQPKDKIRNLKRDGAGLEIKGDAGYVLLPGSSTHAWRLPVGPRASPAQDPAHCSAGARAGLCCRHADEGQRQGQRRLASGQPPREWPVARQNAQESANDESGQLANPYREMASGQLPKTALAEWFETDVREGGRNHALARGVGLMAAAGTPKPAAEAAAKWWCRHRCQPPLIGPEVGRTFEFHLQGRGQEADHRARRRRRLSRPRRPFHARIYRAGHSAAAPCA